MNRRAKKFAVRIRVLVRRKYKKGRKVRKCFPSAPTHSPMQVSQLPGEWNLLVTCPVFHIQERSKTLNCHSLIFLIKYNVNLPLLFHILKASHKRKLPTSLTYGSSLSNSYIMYLLNVKMLLVLKKPRRWKQDLKLRRFSTQKEFYLQSKNWWVNNSSIKLILKLRNFSIFFKVSVHLKSIQ